MTPFNVPSGAAATVYIIDSTMRLHDMPASLILKPSVDGLEKFPPLASWAFLVQNSEGKKVLFDLSMPANIHNCPPLVSQQLKDFNVVMNPNKDVADVLIENGVELCDIGSIIWSHWHFDHVGDIATFPSTTEVVVGPGFMEAYYPGYPTHPASHLHENYFRNRNFREISFLEKGTVKIGAFPALDFFGDGSFYLLDTPGHAAGHLAGLVRTTTGPDTFILMGADMSHHGGEMRPTPLLPIPDEVLVHNTSQSGPNLCFCGAAFRQVNVNRGRKEDEPFFDPIYAEDSQQAARTIQDAQGVDARSDVFVVCAHDMGIVDVVEFFPRNANGWKEKGWKEKTLWSFLSDLTAAASTSAGKAIAV